jgi:L-aspartate oxidase
VEFASDILVIGSGISGLFFALKAAEKHSVSIITKKSIEDTNTQEAQGGIAAVWEKKTDSIKLHVNDTLKAGDGLCHRAVVEKIIEKGPETVRELIDNYSVNFDLHKDGTMELGLEGAHSVRRVLHAKDMTGLEIQTKLSEAAKKHPNITVFENHIGINLFVENNHCYGAYVLDKTNSSVINFSAYLTVLATGGAGKVFLYTSNPDVATGDGIAMAYRAGAKVRNMELMQFHPTCLYHPYAKSFLVTEALRGEGAILCDHNGKPFMQKYHKLKELAPRDVVARSIDNELKTSGIDHVYLDISHKDPNFVKNRFPTIYRKCMKFNIDITKDPIPVVPAAHYMIGGIKSKINGKTSVENLLAIGEVASTGLHGANRLASNSLLEGVVCASEAAKFAQILLNDDFEKKKFPYWDPGSAQDSNEQIIISQNWDEIRQFMMNYVGIVRSNSRLERARKRAYLVQQEINQYYWDFIVTSDLIELRNIALCAWLIIESAKVRKESRGVHYSLDYPQKLPKPLDTELQIAQVRMKTIN